RPKKSQKRPSGADDPAGDEGIQTIRVDGQARYSDLLDGGAKLKKASEFEMLERELDRHLKLTSGLLATSVVAGLGFPLLQVAALPGFVYAATPFVSEAYKQVVKERRVGLAVIDAIFMVGMIGMGRFITLSAFGTLYLGSRKALLRSRSRTRDRLTDIFAQRPDSVWVFCDGAEISVPFQDLEVGDVVVVTAGETVPVDGVIVHGNLTIDERALTGESQPADKGAGDEVFASTVIVSGAARVSVSRTGADTVTAQISAVLQQTADRKSTAEQRGERIAEASAVPMVGLGAATLAFLGPSKAFAVMVGTPGYSLRITSPTSVLNFLELTAEQGILIKDGRAFEHLADVDTVIFDKTGTLTEDRLQVHTIHTCGALGADELLRYVATAERKQSHPIALAILDAFQRRRLEPLRIDDSTYEVGYGLRATIANRLVRVGSQRFMEMEQRTIPENLRAAQKPAERAGHTLVYCAIDDEVVGAIELEAVMRPEAMEVIAGLRARDITTYILSGDREVPTRNLAVELGIDHYFAEKLPEDKSDVVAQLRAEGRTVCFIGDGINDAIALQRADISVSLSGATGCAQDAAQIILLDSSLRRVPKMLDLADAQRQNFRTGVVISMLPAGVGILSVYLLGAGVATTSALSILGLLGGGVNAMLPRVRHGERPAPSPSASAIQPGAQDVSSNLRLMPPPETDEESARE
ncbi:MAG: heavy metal translocating P-type ATPase, partial [Acidobacteriota bacterium]